MKYGYSEHFVDIGDVFMTQNWPTPKVVCVIFFHFAYANKELFQR